MDKNRNASHPDFLPPWGENDPVQWAKNKPDPAFTHEVLCRKPTITDEERQTLKTGFGQILNALLETNGYSQNTPGTMTRFYKEVAEEIDGTSKKPLDGVWFNHALQGKSLPTKEKWHGIKCVFFRKQCDDTTHIIKILDLIYRAAVTQQSYRTLYNEIHGKKTLATTPATRITTEESIQLPPVRDKPEDLTP